VNQMVRLSVPRAWAPCGAADLLRVAVAVAVAALPGTGVAATVAWDGGGATSEWTERANWELDALPTTTDTALIVGATATITGAIVPTVSAVNLGSDRGPGGLVVSGSAARAQLTVRDAVRVAPSSQLTLGAAGTARSLLTADQFETGGTVVVGSRGDLLATASLVQTGGTVEIRAGGTAASPAAAIRAGLLRGGGVVQGSVSVGDGSGAAATLSPGLGIGTLSIVGSVKFASDARLLVEWTATGGAARWDQLQVSGEVELGGVLDLSQIGAGDLTPGVRYDFLTAGSLAPHSRFRDITGLPTGFGSLVPSFDLTGQVGVNYTIIRGDMNGDQKVDESDVEKFAWAIRDGATYHKQFVLQGNAAFASLADMDLDGDRTFADIPLFLDAVAENSGSAALAAAALQAIFAPVPEPAAGLLAAAGAAAACGWRRSRTAGSVEAARRTR